MEGDPQVASSHVLAFGGYVAVGEAPVDYGFGC
jgi:hypothetical protein